MAWQEPSNLPNHRRNMANTRHRTNGVDSRYIPRRGRSKRANTKCHRKSRAQIYNPSITFLPATGLLQIRHHSPQMPHSLPDPTPTTSLSTTALTPRTAVSTTRLNPEPEPARHVPAALHARLPHHYRRRTRTRPPCHQKTTGSHPYRASEQQRRRRIPRPRRIPTSSRSCRLAPLPLRLDPRERSTMALRA